MRISLISIGLLVSVFTLAQDKTFTLRSNDLGGQATQDQVFNGSGCTGKNISPHLIWENAPAGTKSFAITMYDPDAPTGSGWWHWVVVDLPKDITSVSSNSGNLKNGAMPAGARQMRTDYGTPGYGGPCPPEGDRPHCYIITVFALPTEKVDVPDDASPALVGFNLNASALAKASLVFYHSR